MSKRLGKGLDAIFGENLESVLEEIQSGGSDHPQTEIELKEIRPNPYQPRKVFDESKIQELAQSIREHGVFTPVLVRKSLQGYELIAGERRVRASKEAKKTTIPAIILEFTEEQMMEISLLENIQREDLNAIEEANAYQRLVERMGYTQEQLAEQLSVSRQAISKWESGQSVPESDKLIVISNYFKVSLDYLLKEESEQETITETPATDDSMQTNDRTKWLLGIITCVGGILCLIVWGLLSILNPAASDQLSESSMIQIDGNGIFLILCLVAIIVGAVLLLKNTRKK